MSNFTFLKNRLYQLRFIGLEYRSPLFFSRPNKIIMGLAHRSVWRGPTYYTDNKYSHWNNWYVRESKIYKTKKNFRFLQKQMQIFKSRISCNEISWCQTNQVLVSSFLTLFFSFILQYFEHRMKTNVIVWS